MVREKKDRGRYIPRAVRRAVYVRDLGRCSYVAEDGRRCDVRDMLEFDHGVAYAHGGAHRLENLYLRCRSHNALRADETFGCGQQKRKVAAARAKRIKIPVVQVALPLM